MSGTRAVLYARYSSDQQRPTSIEDQFRNCRQRVEAEGWSIVTTYADEAITGADSRRPQYVAMLAAAEARGFDILLVDDLGRFARDQVESERAIRRLEFLGIRILAVTDGYDSHSKTSARKIQRGVKNLLNEMRLDELREQVLRGKKGQALKQYWLGGRPYGYRLKPILDPAKTDAYGQPARIGTVLEIESTQAQVVQEIFTRYSEGASCFVIASELNARGVASPGSTWKRKVRRCHGWMDSSVRVILLNPLYTGHVRWNVCQVLRDPDSGKDKRLRRPATEWIEHHDETLRIVSDELFERSKARRRTGSNGDKRLKSGGKSKYLLSGLLICKNCGAHYVMSNEKLYSCSSYRGGQACSNTLSIARDAVQQTMLRCIYEQLLAPDRMKRIAQEMEATYRKDEQERAAKAHEAPKELHDLEARIARLRQRMVQGDPDMTADELQAALERAELKRRQLLTVKPQSLSLGIQTALPQLAKLYVKKIRQGLDGDPATAAEARSILREFMPDSIRVTQEADGSVWAESEIQPAALLRKVVSGGRDERI